MLYLAECVVEMDVPSGKRIEIYKSVYMPVHCNRSGAWVVTFVERGCNLAALGIEIKFLQCERQLAPSEVDCTRNINFPFEL
jgi:hypothetical protein